MKQYRAVQYRDSDNGVEQLIYEGTVYKDAHFQCLQYDGDYWPEFYHVVERSLDGGITWHTYNADEWIDGRPAWTIEGL